LVTREKDTKTETIARARELIAAVLDPPPSINALQEVHRPDLGCLSQALPAMWFDGVGSNRSSDVASVRP
jgi:hypothetical protein